MSVKRFTHAGVAIAVAAATFGAAAVTTAVVAPAASAATCTAFGRTLSQGATGADVTELQILVAGWAATSTVVGIDGSFGPATLAAVKRFQSAYGLAADGVVGPMTIAKLNSLRKSDCTPAHFTIAEASANCGKGFTGTSTQREAVRRAIWRAEALRHQLGDKPLKVTSGFRDSACNASVGGSSTSRHLTGNALDLVPISGTGLSLCSIARQARYAGTGTLLGPGYPDHGDHVHLDNKTPIFWSASSCF